MNPLNDQRQLAEQKKTALKEKQDTVDGYQRQWDERDQGVDNSALEADLNGAK